MHQCIRKVPTNMNNKHFVNN